MYNHILLQSKDFSTLVHGLEDLDFTGYYDQYISTLKFTYVHMQLLYASQ